MRIFCECEAEMVLEQYEPDQDGSFIASFVCEDTECGGTASVTFSYSNVDGRTQKELFIEE